MKFGTAIRVKISFERLRPGNRAVKKMPSAERSAFLDLIHVRILWETLYDLAEVARGYESDWHYITTNIHSADHLHPNDFI